MKIYLAATAPGNETPEFNDMFEHRLLSYYLIIKKTLECDKVFNLIKDENTIRVRTKR